MHRKHLQRKLTCQEVPFNEHSIESLVMADSTIESLSIVFSQALNLRWGFNV